MAQIEIINEREAASGWVFEIQVLSDTGSLSKHHLTLAWADYNLWSGDGGDQPAQVADAVIGFMLARMNVEELPSKFDASLARRMHRDADQVIPTLIA